MPKKKILSVALLIICMLLSITIASCGSLIFTLTYESENGGSIQGSKIQQVFKGDFGDKVIAVADEGYEFTGWSDGITTPERQDTKVSVDLTVTAQFKKIEQPQPPVIVHQCESICGVCGKCTNLNCGEQVCAVKCDCEQTHSHNYVVSITQPTCTEQGFTTFVCDCGDSYIDNYVSATGHTPQAAVIENHITATCTTQGSYNEVVRCKDCNTVISSTPKNESTTPHNYINGLCASCGTKDSTIAEHTCKSVCEKCGKCLNEQCSEQACIIKCDCNKEESHTHNYTATVTQPTCTEQGFTTFVCDCGESYIDNYVSATGHTPQNAVIENYISATCTTQGSYNEVVYCQECNTVISSMSKIEPTTPHNYVDGLCASCGAKDPTIPEHTCESVCEKCGKCLNEQCGEQACGIKCDCVAVPPHVCESVCDKCGKCTNANCAETVCLEKCACSEQPVQKEYYTVTYLGGEGGKIIGNAVQTVKAGGSGTTVSVQVNPGYQFWGWSDRYNESTALSYNSRRETNVTQDITVTAMYKPCVYIYQTAVYGKLICNGEEGSLFELYRKDDGTFDEITAVCTSQFWKFVGWSDGVTSATRKDIGSFAGRKVVSPRYEQILERTVSYIVDDNFGGSIVGNTNQIVEAGANSQPVTAVADDGYIFMGWSGLSMESTRYETNVQNNLEFYAYFDLIEKTYTFNYNGANQALQTSITLNRYNDLTNIKFPVPQRAGYTFCGWYLEEDFKNKVADENGKYYYGYMSFSVKETELYAKWKKIDEEQTVPVYKTLLIVNDKIVASLWSGEIQDYVDVDYQMLTMERRTLNLVSQWFAYLLNEWLEGEVIFEVDTYYTTQTLIPQSYNPDNWKGEKVLYQLMPYDIPEIADISDNYNSRILFFGLRNLMELNNSNTAGMARLQDAFVILDIYYLSPDCLEPYFYRESSESQIMKHVYEIPLFVAIHEFCHTVEEHGISGCSNCYHMLLNRSKLNAVQAGRLFLRDEVEEYGLYHGIQREFWPQVWIK